MFIGGGMEESETPTEAAEREITEETGYKNLKFIKQSNQWVHNHFYSNVKDKNIFVHMMPVLFELEDEEQIDRKLDDGEDKFTIEWVDEKDLAKVIDEPAHYYGYQLLVNAEPKKLKIGLIKEFMGEGVDNVVKNTTLEFTKKLRQAGHLVEEVELPMVKYALPIYYIVVPAEISSNLARYDGIRYGQRAGDASSLAEVYGRSRDQGFVDENKRRIMIGSFVLSSGYFDAYYLQAQKARTLLINEFDKLFEKYDFLIGPTAPTPAFKIGENTADPLKMYLADIMTVPASLAGLPAISVPAGADENGLPIGLQIIGPQRSDAQLLTFAKGIEK
jgi:Asp-tRNA(Asn)/Glu-tRNA(Gln) amidotransferase A subunit family amidase